MSAVEEYRKADAETTYTSPQELSTARKAKAAIAELEAELSGTQAALNAIIKGNVEACKERNAARAELAKLKGENERLKCCGNCKHSEYDGSFFDCEWQPRGEDEWDDLAYPSLNLCCYSPSRWEARP